MSPKKTVKNPTSKIKITEKMPKRTVKKEKSKPNMPANLKVSIPLTRKSSDSTDLPKPRGRQKKSLDYETRIELANEVARKQLMKSVAHHIEVPPVHQLEVESHPLEIETHPLEVETRQSEVGNIIPNRKRGRQKKVQGVSNFFQSRHVYENNGTDVAVTTLKKPAKNTPAPIRRIVTRKRLADSTAQNESKCLKVDQNVTPGGAVIKTEDLSDDIPAFPELPDSNTVEPQPIILESKPVVQPQLTGVQLQLTDVQSQPTGVQPQPTGVQLQPTGVQLQPTGVQPQRTVKQPKSTVKKPIVKQPRPKVKPPPTMKQPAARKKRTPKGKQDNVVVGANSPSILEKNKKLPHKETENQIKNQQIQPKPAELVDSRKSSISSNSNLSWTKDISSSSTTTCITVSSSDFVRFNKKLPILKLTNIDNEVNRLKNSEKETATVIHEADDDSSDTSDSSDSSDSEHKFTEQLNNSIEINSLHLSASSPSSSSQICGKESSPDYTKAADKLTVTMKKIDMEIINWISSENTDVNANLAKFKNKMFEILDHEFGVITHCRRLKEILEPRVIEERIENPCVTEPIKDTAVNNTEDDTENNPILEKNNEVQINKEIEINKEADIIKEVEFVKPRPCRKLSNISDGNFSITNNNNARDDSSDDDNPTGYTRNYPYSDHHDDDDALSLFAESITGFESSRMNTSIASAPNARQVEEYIPQPLKDDFVPHIEKHTYCPTKIREAENIASKIKNICEKQNADSTSIYKQSNSTDDAESYQDFNEHTELDIKTGPPEMIPRPRLMESLFQVAPKTKSVVFDGLCFYNLINCCRKMVSGQCRFRHRKPMPDEIKAKLTLLDERTLVQEYLLLRNWTYLRRQYGICYVEVCAKRGLTRILVEMAYDFIIKARNIDEDTQLRVDTIEVTLMHLNNVDLSVCEDLLKLTIHSDQINRTLLCDVFMATMSITQNFSRFKRVFLNLTYFMVDNDRVFNKDVVEHILERICILPFEEPIARALIQMMRMTRPEIFKNSNIRHFEEQIAVNKDVYEEYSLLKNQYEFATMLASSVVTPSPPPPPPPPPSGEPRDERRPAPSPDTTNLDNMNKMGEEKLKPLITRTIGMNPPIIFNRVQTSPGGNRAHTAGPSRGYNSSGSSNSDDNANQNIRKWRNRAVFPHLFPPPNAMRPPRLQMRHGQRNFNERLVTFRGPANYVRHPGPKY